MLERKSNFLIAATLTAAVLTIPQHKVITYRNDSYNPYAFLEMDVSMPVDGYWATSSHKNTTPLILIVRKSGEQKEK